MNTGTARKLGLAAIAAGLLLCAQAARAGDLPEPADRLAAYEVAIATGDPTGAVLFLRDGEARELAAADPSRSASLLGKAEALKDLKELLALPWDDKQVNQLNRSLTIRIDTDRPLVKMGIGPQPEKLLTWLGKFQPKYPERKKQVVKKAIRQWEVIFGTLTTTRQMSWGQASMFRGTGVNVTRTAWEDLLLRERNSIIEKIIKVDPGFLIYNDERLAAARDEVAVGIALRQIKDSGALTPTQVGRLNTLSFKDQIYMLGNMFDNSNIEVDPKLKAAINSARSSLPQEVLPARERELLGGMLNSAVAGELKGTQAGDIALRAFPGGLRITVAPVTGAYSRYDAASGSIVLDSETIQQYMRIKGFTASSLMSSKAQLAEIAKYMSPVVVYEAAHKAQIDWAASKGIYLPATQENEIEAMSLEGLYTTEKIKKDAAFLNILTSSRDFSTYAAKRMDIGTEYRSKRTKGFATTVRQRYFSGTPSLDAAASQILEAVTTELERRSKMTAREKADIDAVGFNLQDTMGMSPAELSYSVKEMQASVLAKIQSDLANLGVYRGHFIYAERRGRKALKYLEAGNAAKPGAPPKPI